MSSDILIIDQDVGLCHVMTEQKKQKGLEALDFTHVTTGEEALERVRQYPYDLILIQATLPDMTGFDLSHQMRKANLTSAPCLLLVTPDEVRSALLRSTAGAYDFLVRPVRLKTLVSRISHHLYSIQCAGPRMIGMYQFDPCLKTLACSDGQSIIRLTGKEVCILEVLDQARHTEVSRTVLLHEVWGYHSDTDTHTLETHIYRLRQKIEPDPVHPQILGTTPGGYFLIPGPNEI